METIHSKRKEPIPHHNPWIDNVYSSTSTFEFKKHTGDLIGDRFQIDGPAVGKGNLGIVYKVVDSNHDEFAIKQLPNELLHYPRVYQRLFQDFQKIQNLHQPNIKSYFEFFEEDGSLYLLSEWIEGMSLRRILDREQQIPFELSCFIMLKLFSVLLFLKEHQLHCGELKLENILVSLDGEIKVTDYGLFWSDYDLFCQTKETFKTHIYSPPERFMGKTAKTLGLEGDFYSLGLIWLEMITGKLPVDYQSTHFETLKEWKKNRDLSFLTLHPEPQINMMLQGLLKKNPEERTLHTEELFVFLQNYACSATYARTLFREWFAQLHDFKEQRITGKMLSFWKVPATPSRSGLLFPESKAALPKGKEPMLVFVFFTCLVLSLWSFAFWIETHQKIEKNPLSTSEEKSPSLRSQVEKILPAP